MQNHRLTRWLTTVTPDASIVSRSSSVLGAVSAAKAGIGIAPLPTTLGHAEDKLVQVLPAVEELNSRLVSIDPPDLRKTPRIAAFVDCVLDDIPALRQALIG